MRGYIYNNPQLAYEEDGYYTFGDNKPHDYWCVLRVFDNGDVFLAPIFFDVMDNLPDSVIDSCPCQIDNVTVGIGRCIVRPQSMLGEPVIYMNPEKVKQACNILTRSIRREG